PSDSPMTRKTSRAFKPRASDCCAISKTSFEDMSWPSCSSRAMARLLQLGHDMSSKEVFDIAQQSDARGLKAREVFRVMGESLGVLLATLMNTFNFPLYLLSGGMLPAWDLFAPPMLAEAGKRSYIFRAANPKTIVAQATLGNEAGLYGAAYLPWVESETR